MANVTTAAATNATFLIFGVLQANYNSKIDAAARWRGVALDNELKGVIEFDRSSALDDGIGARRQRNLRQAVTISSWVRKAVWNSRTRTASSNTDRVRGLLIL
jgi:hypothetical protein